MVWVILEFWARKQPDQLQLTSEENQMLRIIQEISNKDVKPS